MPMNWTEYPEVLLPRRSGEKTEFRLLARLRQRLAVSRTVSALATNSAVDHTEFSQPEKVTVENDSAEDVPTALDLQEAVDG